MKFKKEIILFTILLGLIFCIGATPNHHNTWDSQEDDENSVETRDKMNLKSADNEIIIITPEEKAYMEIMSGYYPATYGFENDAVGGGARNWDRDTGSSDLYGEIADSYKNHIKVFKLYDNIDIAAMHIYNNFNDQNYGTVELWLLGTHDDQWSSIKLQDQVTTVMQLTLNPNNYLSGLNGSTSYPYTEFGTLTKDTWYHIRIDFRMAGALPYEGLSDDSYIVYLNGTKANNELKFSSTGYPINRLMITSGVSAYNYYTYLDAVGYSWDPNYEIENNRQEGLLLSFENTTALDWMGYSLDGNANKTIYGNITLSMPEGGLHTIQVCGNDSLGKMYCSAIRHFSSYYNLTGNPIFIDDSDPNYSWTKITLENPWCSGSGTWNDPYLIEYVSIDGNNIGTCITINNSNVYFTINNCLLYNAETGIKILNATNFNINDNNIYNIHGKDGANGGTGANGGDGTEAKGIVIDNCTNINISLNQISNIYGGKGGKGGKGENGVTPSENGRPGGKGGNGGSSSGFYIEDSINISNKWNNISNIIGGNGSDGGEGGKGVDEMPPLFPAGNGGRGGTSGLGGNSSGFHFINCFNITNDFNYVKQLIGGQGGKGGDGGEPGEGGVRGDGYEGGRGGNAAGIYFERCEIINNRGNSIKNLISGNGGDRGFGSSGYIGGEGGFSAGSYFIYSMNIINDYNNISNIFGGKGGRTVPNYYAEGGICYGIYFGFATNTSNDWNNISDLLGGEGGESYGENRLSAGIWVESSNNCSNIYNNIMKINGGNSIILEYSNNITLLNNNCSYSKVGIYLISSSQENKIIYNNVSNNLDGITITESHETYIKGNIIKDNSVKGIYIDDLASNNIIYQNEFSGNLLHAVDDGINTQWDNGSIGNYWDDYGGTDEDGDGIGEIPYFIPGIGGGIDYYPICVIPPPPILDVDIMDQSFSIETFNLTFYIFNASNYAQGIEWVDILSWTICWNGTDVSDDIIPIGGGYYRISLEPIIISLREDPILLNMTISAESYVDLYFELYIAAEFNSIEIDLIALTYSEDWFNFTFCISNASNPVQGIEWADILSWIICWNGTDVSGDIIPLGSGYYRISLESITILPGEGPILLNMTIAPEYYFDLYYDLYIAVERELEPEICLIDIDIIEQTCSENWFNLTFHIYNASNPAQGIEWADILSWTFWWNGTDIKGDIIPLGDGYYTISLEPITVMPGEYPIRLNGTIVATGFEQKEFEFFIAVDPELIEKIPESEPAPPSDGGGGDGEAKKAEEPVILVIALVAIGVGSGIGISAIAIILFRKRIFPKRKIENNK